MNQMTRISREDTSLRQQTTKALRSAILEGIFLPGQKLSEREICERLEVSRSCVRESLQHLQAEGLITIVPHRGPEVTALTPTEVREIYAVRASLESLAVQGFIINASPAQRQALRAKVTELAQLAQAVNHSGILEIKNQFYDILMTGCGNALVGQLLRQLNNRVTVMRRLSMAQPGRLPHTISELDALVGAIEQGNVQEAERLCQEHIRNASLNVLANIGQMPVR